MLLFYNLIKISLVFMVGVLEIFLRNMNEMWSKQVRK